uniref:Uncharacterized protein n=1 Tax=Rhizophagus irregularis (strain DAOM 181602 / DAOM 197198 / MUCL 43194) TaxID=747089 RepID=U9U973_RHIID
MVAIKHFYKKYSTCNENEAFEPILLTDINCCAINNFPENIYLRKNREIITKPGLDSSRYSPN